MGIKQEAKLTPFEQAQKVREKIKRGVETTGQIEITVPPWLTAILIGFPSQFLKETGILLVSKKEGTRIVVSQERYSLIEEAFAWVKEDEASQNRVLADLYVALFNVGQASLTSGVETAQILKPNRELINSCANQFLPLEGLAEYVEGGGELTDLDLENLSGTLAFIFGRLKVAGHPRVQVWEGKGMVPENLFVTPDE